MNVDTRPRHVLYPSLHFHAVIEQRAFETITAAALFIGFLAKTRAHSTRISAPPHMMFSGSFSHLCAIDCLFANMGRLLENDTLRDPLDGMARGLLPEDLRQLIALHSHASGNTKI